MKVFIDNKGKKYKDSVAIENMGSHYAYDTNDITISEVIINLKQVTQHSKWHNVSIEHTFIQHCAHETIHKLLAENISFDSTIAFDNIASGVARKKHGDLDLKHWFSGFYCGETK